MTLSPFEAAPSTAVTADVALQLLTMPPSWDTPESVTVPVTISVIGNDPESLPEASRLVTVLVPPTVKSVTVKVVIVRTPLRSTQEKGFSTHTPEEE